MERIYAPWRYEYITEETIEGCVFCHASKNSEDDEKLGVLFRDEDCFVIMNKYPYSPGHMMVIPHFHANNIEDISDELWIRISLRVKQATKMLKDIMNAEGVNIGMNMGKAAGAGIEQHIHYHILPRWVGDTNFITTVATTRVYPADFQKIYLKLKENSSKYFQL